MDKFLEPFIISFIASVSLTIFFIWLSGKIKWDKRRKGDRHIHAKDTFRLGGVAIIASFILAILIDQNLVMTVQLWGVVIAAIVMLVVGMIDDLRELFWKTQFFFQVAIALLIFLFGTQIEFITNPFNGIINFDTQNLVIIGAAILIFWVVALINAMNWLDGIDGLAGGVTFISAMTLFFLSLEPQVNQPPLAIVCMALSGSVLGFLIFNFYPAKILAGTSGSMFMGFTIAVIAVFAGAKIATALLTLALPLIDSVWVIIERMKNGQSIFKPDNRHLHYKLLELGWSQRKITFSYYAITIAIAIVALNTRAVGKFITLVLIVIIMLVAFFIINQRINTLRKKHVSGVK